MLCRFWIKDTASLRIVRVFSPKKSIFSSPALSTTELSNWVTNRSESLASITGTKLVISSGVMITPQAWIPVLRTDPSKIQACCTVLAARSCPCAIFLSSVTFGKSLPTFSLSSSSGREKIFLREILGTSLAIWSASFSGRSKTRAVSLIDDLAAIVP